MGLLFKAGYGMHERVNVVLYRENVIFHHVVCHLMCGAEIWHHVAYVSSTYSYLWQQLDLALLGSSYIIATRMPTHRK